jgi:hypothetical protein
MVSRVVRWRFALTAIACVLAPLTPGSPAEPSFGVGTAPDDAPPAISGCPILPANNIWNARVDTLPVHSRSVEYIDSIGRWTGLKMNFGSGYWKGESIGIPYTTVNGTQPSAPIHFVGISGERGYGE